MDKILIFNNYYLPAEKFGGPVTSLVSIIENLGDRYDFYVIAANHDFGESTIFEGIDDGWNQVGKAKVKYIDLHSIYFKPGAVEKLILEVKPDLVWCEGILVPSDKWFIAAKCRKLHIPMLISPRGEVCHNAFHTKYPKKAVVAFIARLFGVYRNVYFHSASTLEHDGLQEFYRIKEDKIFLVPNIPGLLYAKEHAIEKEPSQLRIVFLSRIQDTKNLLLAIEAAGELKGQIVFDVYGPKESEEYWQKCEQAIAKLPDNIKLTYKGVATPKEVRPIFMSYHCFLFPTITENYSHAIAEALSVSCPIIISRGATPWDDIEGRAGYTCRLNDKAEFVEALRRIEAMDSAEYAKLVNSTKAYYDGKSDESRAVERHIEMIDRCIESGKKNEQ